MRCKFIHTISLIFIAMLLASCGTNKNAAEQNESTVEYDITRPPEFVKRQQESAEGDPEETISMEEWEKQQQKSN